MMRRLRMWLAMAAVLLVAGCADPVVFSEVFQQKVGEEIRTRYNLWYGNPKEISSLNIQQGSFLPVGSRIEPVGIRHHPVSGIDDVIFRDEGGREYVIKFDPGYRLNTVRDFVAMTFTTEGADTLFQGISEPVRNRILRGEVVPGMTRREVMLAYGPPPAVRTPDLRSETWFYWITPSETVRVVFRGDKVRNVLKIDELK